MGTLFIPAGERRAADRGRAGRGRDRPRRRAGARREPAAALGAAAARRALRRRGPDRRGGARGGAGLDARRARSPRSPRRCTAWPARWDSALGAEAAAERDRRFLVSAIAHDLRTPLFTLRGSLEAIERGIGNGDALARAQRKADHLDRLVGDLFAFLARGVRA
jgi:signal transduction histidine kinase